MANRIDGIMSGLDTEGLIKGMLSYQQAQIDRLKKNNQMLTWERERYGDIYGKIDTYRTKLYDYKLDAKTVIKSALSSNDNQVSAVATADAAVGTHNITVHQLAAGAQTGSQSAMGSSSDKTSITSQFTDPSTGGPYGGTFKIQINGKDITVDTSKSMNDLAKQINNAGAGVTASYDANTDRFFISTNKTGAEAKIDFNPVDSTGAALDLTNPANADYAIGVGFLQNALKLPTTGGAMQTIQGQDAEFDLDGITGLTQSSNEFTISGINYTLKEADSVNPKTTTVTVNNDTDGIYQSVVDFVNMYNELLGSVNDTLYEQKVKGFEPLTDEEKAAMSPEQVKTWEENAKKGVLRNDALIMGLQGNMRQIMYSPVKGIDSQMVDGRRVTYNSLFAIGLKTGDYSTNGKLEIDEAKLKAAIAADPDAVNKIINGGLNADGTRTEGVADKLYDSLKVSMDRINDRSGAAAGGKEITSTLAKQIASNDKAIALKVDRYNSQMATYYKEFDAMEKLLQQMQSQQDSFYNYLGGGG